MGSELSPFHNDSVETTPLTFKERRKQAEVARQTRIEAVRQEGESLLRMQRQQNQSERMVFATKVIKETEAQVEDIAGDDPLMQEYAQKILNRGTTGIINEI